MSPRLRKVNTASSATAVQIVRKHRGKLTVLIHLGSAHTEAELTALLAAGEEKLANYGAAEQLEVELGLPTDATAPPRARTVVGSRSTILIIISSSVQRNCFNVSPAKHDVTEATTPRMSYVRQSCSNEFDETRRNLTKVESTIIALIRPSRLSVRMFLIKATDQSPELGHLRLTSHS